MSVSMSEEIFERTVDESDIPPIGSDEMVIDVSGESNIGTLVHCGRVRLHGGDGSVAEISNPHQDRLRDPGDYYHVELRAELVDKELNPEFHSGPLPAGAHACVSIWKTLRPKPASDITFRSSGRYGLGPMFRDVRLFDVQKVELIVSRDRQSLEKTIRFLGSRAL